MSRFVVVPKPRKGKRGWWGDITLPTGRRTRPKLGETLKAAEIRAREITLRLAEGKPIEIRGNRGPTFAEFVGHEYNPKKEGGRSWSHEQWRMNRLLAYFGNYPIRSIDLTAIEQFIRARRAQDAKRKKTKVKNATVNRELARLKNILYEAERRKVIVSNPMRRYPIGGNNGLLEEPRTRFITKLEFEVLIKALPEAIRRLVVVAVFTGMRLGELLKLEWADVSLKSRRVIVRLDKDGNSRVVPIGERVLEVLCEVPETCRMGKVFVWDDGRPIRDFRGSFGRACSETGIEDLHFHDLRHTAITWMLDAGVPPRTVAEIVGHKTLVMIMRYAHVVDPMKDEAIKKLDSYAHQSGSNLDG